MSSLILDEHPELTQTLNERVFTDPWQTGGSVSAKPGQEKVEKVHGIALDDLCSDECVVIRCSITIPHAIKAGLGLRGAMTVTSKSTKIAMRVAAKQKRKRAIIRGSKDKNATDAVSNSPWQRAAASVFEVETEAFSNPLSQGADLPVQRDRAGDDT
eukprot:SAG22_NODE_1516_length_4248_cov_83.377042_2_plen_157_part_00